MTDKSVRGPFTSCAQDMWTSFNSSRLKGSFNLLLITFTWLVTTRAAMYASNMNRSIKWNNKVWWHTMSTRLLLLPRTWKATWIEFSPNTNTNGTIAYTRNFRFPNRRCTHAHKTKYRDTRHDALDQSLWHKRKEHRPSQLSVHCIHEVFRGCRAFCKYLASLCCPNSHHNTYAQG